jgi:hypothetical protein
MTRMNPLLRSAFILFALAAVPLCEAFGQENLTFAGHIVIDSAAQQSNPRFGVKLYPPLKSGKAVLLTNTDSKGNFKFTGLSASSYLLEIYLVKDLVYQEVIPLNHNLTREIDLRKNSGTPPAPRPDQAPKLQLTDSSNTLAGMLSVTAKASPARLSASKPATRSLSLGH